MTADDQRYTLRQAADLTKKSVDTLRRRIKARELLTAQVAYDAPEEFAALRRVCAEWSAAGAASAARPPGAAWFTGPRRDPTRPDGHRAATPDGPLQLSARELEGLRRLGEAQSTAQFAAGHAVSTNTVRGHVRTLVRKLAASGGTTRCATRGSGSCCSPGSVHRDSPLAVRVR